MTVEHVITEHMDLWTGAVTQKSGSGRGSRSKRELTGIKKLRELILELAVQGKLVPQNGSDEPASELLDRVVAERQKLVTAGAIKKAKVSSQFDSSEVPYSVPNGWVWCRVAAVCRDWGQKQPDGPFRYIDVSAINNDTGQVQDPELLEPDQAPSRARKLVQNGTLIYSTVRPYLKNIAVIEDEFDPEPIASTAFAVVHPLCGMPAKYFLHYLRSPTFVRYVESVQTGIAYPAVNDKQFFSGLVPLPPIAEQHRIVEKVDELMALCDQLEQQTGDQIEAHERLVDTLLDTLTRAANATKLAENWARVQQHFDTLFTTEHSIDRLKQTILQLAVMGRLVPQDAEDGSASDFLAHLGRIKDDLIASGIIKKTKSRGETQSDQLPFELPDSWAWCRLPDLGELARGKSKHRPRNDPALYESGDVPMIQTGDVARADREITTYTAQYNSVGVAQSKLWSRGTLCITIAANIGDTGILSFDACFPDSVVGFKPFDDRVRSEYVEYFLRTAKRHLNEFAPSTAQKNINLEVLEGLLVPLPPPAEIARVVQRLDELMALCDRLSSELSIANHTRVHLAEAVVEQAVN